MTCRSCFGGGGTQSRGKGSSRAGAVPDIHDEGNYTSIKWFPLPKYNYRGGRLYPDPLPNSFVRKRSDFFDFKDESCECGVGNGFVGRRLDDGTIQSVFVGLPGSQGPIDRPTTFKRPYKFWDNAPRQAPNGRLAVARSRKQLEMNILKPVVFFDCKNKKGDNKKPRNQCVPSQPHGACELIVCKPKTDKKTKK